jgi:hypothetical protein
MTLEDSTTFSLMKQNKTTQSIINLIAALSTTTIMPLC